ncbi:MAG: 4-vinyl reductase [Opitutales bacterium]|nr:4-vinyl reductase [Opitutales bacterium]MCH8539428.1 hypothetical protein [Opitutales bacterium]
MQNTEEILSALNLDDFFKEETYVYDLEQGTVKNTSGTRIVYVSADLMKGIQQALYEETAEAWKIIFKNCGQTWGKKVAANFDRDIKKAGYESHGDLPIEGYISFIEEYFRQHGWGELRMDISMAQEQGLVTARLQNSYFVAVLDDVDDFVDSLLAGILQGFLEYVSGQELGSEEIACAKKGADECVFAITAASRLEQIESHIGEESAEQILERLAS